MKKFIAVMLILCIILILSACSTTQEINDTNPEIVQEKEQVTTIELMKK